MYIKAAQVTFKSKDGVLETQEGPAIDDKVLSAKSRARGIKFPTNKAHRARDRVDKDEALGAKKPTAGIRFPTDRALRVRNRVDKDKALDAKKPTMSKGAVRKRPLGSDPSGCSQGEGFKTQERAVALCY